MPHKIILNKINLNQWLLLRHIFDNKHNNKWKRERNRKHKKLRKLQKIRKKVRNNK